MQRRPASASFAAMKSILVLCIGCLIAAICSSCDGLVPRDVVQPGVLSGSITITGGTEAWPTDSALTLVVVAFDNVPTEASAVFGDVLAGRALFQTLTPLRQENYRYRLEVASPPRTFRYVAVALQVGPDISRDWRVLAVRTVDSGLSPAEVTIGVGQTRTENFTVDFSNLPPQPFETP
jgi:hypothetical protein